MRRRPPITPVGLVMIVLVAALLGACGSQNKDEKPAATPVPPTPTTAPVVTRIVTLPPPELPPPTATLAYDVVPVVGQWSMTLDLRIAGFEINPGEFVDELRYSGVATFEVGLDGAIRGVEYETRDNEAADIENPDESAGEDAPLNFTVIDAPQGYFTPNLSKEACNVEILGATQMPFTISGNVYPNPEDDGRLWASLQFVPIQPRDQIERYSLTCLRFNENYSYEKYILWPLMETLGWLSWSFPLESGSLDSGPVDLAALPYSGRTFNGTLTPAIRLFRN